MPNSKELTQEFGRELISARSYKEMTLEQICDITKIQRRYLEALEAGEWDILPQPYMEAFLKTYAETVGMNVPKVMKQYRELRRLLRATEAGEPEGGPEEETAAVPTQPPRLEAVSEKRFTGGIKYFVVALILVAALMVAYLMWTSRKSEPEQRVSEEQQPPTAAESVRTSLPSDAMGTAAPIRIDSTLQRTDSAATMKTTPESLAVVPLEIPVGINLLARARQRCWLRATLDGKEAKEALLAAGDSLILRANDEVRLMVGNAGGLELELDDEPLGVLGPVGKAATVVITPDGIQSQKLGKGRIMPDTATAKNR